VPLTPAAPTRTNSIETAISVAWVTPSSSGLAITGYILNIDNGNNMELKPVYIGTNRPDIKSYTAGGLTTGLPYRFSVQAINENGNSLPSPISTFYSCRNPTNFVTPRYNGSDKTAKTITIDWTKPGYDGGCPITGYRLIRDNGPGTAINIEVSSLTQTDPNLI